MYQGSTVLPLRPRPAGESFGIFSPRPGAYPRSPDNLRTCRIDDFFHCCHAVLTSREGDQPVRQTTVPLYQAKAEFFRMLGHPARIRVLELLQDGPKPVRELLAAM